MTIEDVLQALEDLAHLVAHSTDEVLVNSEELWYAKAILVSAEHEGVQVAGEATKKGK